MKIAAFNTKKLGLRKVNNQFIRDNLVKTLSRYSVVVLLEVMDRSGRAMDRLLQELNSSVETTMYSMTASQPLGRSSQKEKFVCFYREDEVQLIESYQYPDEEDAFSREPLILHFYCPATEVEDFFLIPVHTKPTETLEELDKLDDVVQNVKEDWDTNKIMILGDFNADGRYLSNKKKKQVRIFSAQYHWLIDESMDTTVNENDHTYDRIVVYGQSMLSSVVEGSAKPFNFQEAFELNLEQALKVSDHYPVEVELKMKPKKRGKAQPRVSSAANRRR